MGKMRDNIDRYNILIILIALSFLMRLSFRSNYLDDWDSVQFALAIKDYSIVLHQPHPPGYPIYVFIGRIMNIFINDPTKSLIMVSVMFGSLSLVPTYLITEKFFNKETAILSSIILLLTPAHLLFSEVAMTDIVSLFFVTTTIYLLCLGIEKTKYLYIGSFVLGITSGIRLTDIILISILSIVLIYRLKEKKLRLKELIFTIMSVIIGMSIWLIPIIIDTGFDNLIRAEISQFDYNKNTSTINQGISITFDKIIGLYVTGWSVVFYIFILITLIFTVSEVLKRDINIDRRIIIIIIWLLTYFIYSTFYNDLYISRYLLPQFAPLSIIFSHSMIKILDLVKRPIKLPIAIIFSILIIIMGSQAITGAYTISTTKPAPVQAAEMIKNNYDPDNTVIIAKDSHRHFQYYLPNFTFLRFEDTQDKIGDYANKTIISEGSPVAFVPSRICAYKREKIYPKHQYVLLYENRDLQKQFIMLERDGWVGFGTNGNIILRRMENDAVLRLYSDDNKDYNISFSVISMNSPRTLEIYNGDIKIDHKSVSTNFEDIVLSTNLKKGINTIRFHVTEGCERIDDKCMSIALAAKVLTR